MSVNTSSRLKQHRPRCIQSEIGKYKQRKTSKSECRTRTWERRVSTNTNGCVDLYSSWWMWTAPRWHRPTLGTLRDILFKRKFSFSKENTYQWVPLTNWLFTVIRLTLKTRFSPKEIENLLQNYSQCPISPASSRCPWNLSLQPLLFPSSQKWILLRT